MKRFTLAFCMLMLFVGFQAEGQSRFGVTGGLNFNKSGFTAVSDLKSPVGWNAGVTMSVDLPIGFSVQPSLIYSEKNAALVGDVSQSMGYVELPVSLQWGPDLLIFRPFVDVTPYIGYAVSTKVIYEDDKIASDGLFQNDKWNGRNRFECGIGIGGGIEVWKLQFTARYNWNFGRLYDIDGWNQMKDYLSDLGKESEHFSGITLSVAFFF